ncbi:NAD(P)/FAD-dependent oxidoreductase [Desulfohalovibrio reitneri]|uniref:NAD(P)/FAD-dependent oxidoreductase n=1 Tax=Desulfohalovibrio reitneri TaxID=1307759 RepID=UPI0004A6CB7E|nr:FAD-dependent oxidoreductase [Desulfohalovibrio reitneri]
MNYVIIGNGVASIGAIEGIRKQDPKGDILVVSDENKATYGRPLITYYLAGKVDEKAMPLRPDSFYEENSVRVELGCEVASIDRQAKTVTTACGRGFPYDKLLLATGGAPMRPELPGLDAGNVLSFTTWADADVLREVVKTARKYVVVGAGLIAVKAAEALVTLGLDTTLVVRSRVMRAYFDEEAGAVVRAHLEAKGLKFFDGATPEKILPDESGNARAVRINKGEIPADCVILAMGVSPRTDLASDAGLKVAKGILCDDFMRTSDPDIFAAGDVAQARDMQSGQEEVSPIWPSAYNQGINAGINMAGAEDSYPGGLTMNSITLFGLPTISVGLTDPRGEDGCEVHVHKDEEAEVYRKLIFKDGKLVGCALIGDITGAGVYTSFIHNELELDEETKLELLSGTPSPLYWPKDFFARTVTHKESSIPDM